MCDHHLAGLPGGLVCTNPEPHEGDGHGCTYKNDTGSELNDRHGEQGHG